MKFKHKERKEVFRNNVVTVYNENLILPNGKEVSWTFTGKREVVAILALTERQSVIMVEQYRPAIRREFLEIPAGLVEENELPLEAAKRELEEETGYQADSWTKICSYFGSAGVSDGEYHLFLAKGLKKTQQRLDEDEFLTVKEIPLHDISVYDLQDPKSIIAFQYYLLSSSCCEGIDK